MLERVLKATLLDGRAYEGVADEPQPIIGSMVVVGVVAIAFGLGVSGEPLAGEEVEPALIVSLAVSTTLVSWGLWSATVWFIGRRLLGGSATYRTLLRALGIAFGPGVLLALSGVPSVGLGIALSARFWMLATATVAVREAQSTGWGRAFSAAIVGWWLSQFMLHFLLLPIGVAPVADNGPAAAEQSLDIGGNGLFDLLHGLVL